MASITIAIVLFFLGGGGGILLKAMCKHLDQGFCGRLQEIHETLIPPIIFSFSLSSGVYNILHPGQSLALQE